jgi:serine protease Do
MLPRLFLTVLSAAALAACDPRTPQAPPTPKAAASAPAAALPQASAPASKQVAVAGAPALVPPDFSALVERVGPAVVNVTTTSLRGGPGDAPSSDDPLFDYFRRSRPHGGPRQELPIHGIGSGFIIDAQGYVLTNAHVVADAEQVTVRLPGSKREHKARVVGSDPQTDVALLKVDAGNLPVVTLGDSAQLKAGEWVAAIGSPFGFDSTITAGIVSATERTLPDETYVPFIQTDVPVNPGNSGGPLLNTRGEVVGINSQIYSRSGGYQGVSFAIPISVAMDIAKQLRAEGHVTRGRLGVGIQEVSTQLAQSFKLNEARGALVSAVDPEGPAAKSGFLPGDVILRFAGKDVADAADLPRLVARTAPGTAVDVEVWREAASRTLKTTVGAVPAPPEARTAAAMESAKPSPGNGSLGLGVRELPRAARHALGIDYGLVIESVAGANAEAPLRRGDVVVGVNNQRFKSLDEFKRQVAKAAPGDTVALLVRRGDATVFVPVTVGKG